MLPRPAWLAIGVVAAAAGSTALGAAAGAAAEAVAAAGVAAGLVVGACGCEMTGRRRRAGGRASAGGLAGGLAAASLGAAVVALRVAFGLVLAGGQSPATEQLPTGTGPWQATVESARASKGQQIATLAIVGTGSDAVAGSAVMCSAVAPSYPRLLAGDRVAWSGRVRPLGDSGYEAWLAAQGIAATCEPTELTIVGHDDSAAGRLESFRQTSGDALQRVLPEPEGGLAAAILIGLRDRVDRDVAADFTTAGVSHIVAISGWNIAIVAATVAALLGGLVGRRRRAVVTIGAIVTYTLFAGASPSVVRAAVMAAVALLAVESGRGSRAIVGLAWAVAAMLALEPGTVGDVGFQLSAAATAGLVAWATPLTRRLEERLPRLPGAIRESLSVSLAAQAATLPIALLAFGRLAMIAPASNLVAVPLVPPAMAAGAVAFGAGWLAMLGTPDWLTGLLAMPAWALLAALVWVVRLAAAVPGANETLPFPANVGAAAVATLLLWQLHRFLSVQAGRAGDRAAKRAGPAAGRASSRGPRPAPRPKHRWAFVSAAFVVLLAGCVVASRPDGSVHVIVLDVGQGDAILLEGDHGGRILVDGGPDGGVLLNALDQFVPVWDRHLDAIVLTHPHDDHVGGLVSVLQRYRVDRAFESGWAVSTPTYRGWLDALAARGLRAERLRTGDILRLDDVTLRVLWPDDGRVRPPGLDPAATDNRKTNDSSVVLLGEYENRRFLLTGDAEDDVDPVLLARGLPAVDMLKVAHHGSATASSDELLAAIRPHVAVVSVGAANTYGHPAPATMGRLRATSRTVLRTDQVGTVETTLDAAEVTVTSGRLSSGSRQSLAAGRSLEGGRLARWPRTGVGLLYDSVYVRSRPSRKRGPAALARAAGVAPPSLAGRCRGGGLAGVAGSIGWALARSPPRGNGRSPP